MLNEKDNNNNNLFNNEDENKSYFLFEQYDNMNLKKDYPYESEEFNLNGVFDIKKKYHPFVIR